MVLSSTHKLNYLIRWHPWPLAKLSFCSLITQEIDFLFLSSEFKKKPA